MATRRIARWDSNKRSELRRETLALVRLSGYNTAISRTSTRVSLHQTITADLGPPFLLSTTPRKTTAPARWLSTTPSAEALRQSCAPSPASVSPVQFHATRPAILATAWDLRVVKREGMTQQFLSQSRCVFRSNCGPLPGPRIRQPDAASGPGGRSAPSAQRPACEE